MSATFPGRAPTGRFPGSGRRPIRHGTIGGYRAHYRHGEPMCEPCRHADRVSKGHKAPQRVAQCGTDGGYVAHQRRGETPCRPCKDARAATAERRRLARRGDRWPYELLIPAVADATRQGATVEEIAAGLGVSRLRVARALARSKREPGVAS